MALGKREIQSYLLGSAVAILFSEEAALTAQGGHQAGLMPLRQGWFFSVSWTFVLAPLARMSLVLAIWSACSLHQLGHRESMFSYFLTTPLLGPVGLQALSSSIQTHGVSQEHSLKAHLSSQLRLSTVCSFYPKPV